MKRSLDELWHFVWIGDSGWWSLDTARGSLFSFLKSIGHFFFFNFLPNKEIMQHRLCLLESQQIDMKNTGSSP